jgi:hypothetical protein
VAEMSKSGYQDKGTIRYLAYSVRWRMDGFPGILTLLDADRLLAYKL